MTDATKDIRRQLARLLARGKVREDQREISALVQQIHDRTHANPTEILECACSDAADLLIAGDEL